MLLLAVALLAACVGGGDDDDEDIDTDASEPVASASATSQRSTPVAQPRRGGGASGTAAAAPRDNGLPLLVSNVDVVFDDLLTGKVTFDVDIEARFGSRPQATIVPLEGGTDLLSHVRANVKWLADEGYDVVDVQVVDGSGLVLLNSAVLGGLSDGGFNYDSQYNGDPTDDDLKVDESKARERFHLLGDVFPTIVAQAHDLGLTVNANVESLAHIINLATESGIGGEEDSLSLAANLPPPSQQQVLQFIDEVLAAGADTISAEAYEPKIDEAIAAHLAERGVPYIHSGPDLGSDWVGYYYVPYPDAPGADVPYVYLHAADSLFGTTNGTIFARARAVDQRPRTSVVVGAYVPLPCDPELSVADLYTEARGGDAEAIDNESPALADGTSVANCATGIWRNLLLVAARREGVDRLILAGDLAPAAQQAESRGFGQSVLDRIAAHPAPPDALPVANIILDRPHYTAEDAMETSEFVDTVSLTLLGLVDDALSAAGYQTVLTYDEPWAGGEVALTYIVTAGGNEQTDEEGGVGPPVWSAAQSLNAALVPLLDPQTHPGPVFVQPVWGIPDAGDWLQVREQFGLPERFGFRNPTLSTYEPYHTSLLSSSSVNAEGDTPDRSPRVPVTPKRGSVLGASTLLTPYLDSYQMGQLANYVAPADVGAEHIFASGPLLVPDAAGSAREESAPYLLTDSQGRFLWTVNHLHHEAFTYIVGQAIAAATGRAAVLQAPALAHVWSGRQTFALAYDRTEVTLNLPFDDGEAVDITVYDEHGEPTTEERATPYHAPLRVPLERYSLLVVEPAR